MVTNSKVLIIIASLIAMLIASAIAQTVGDAYTPPEERESGIALSWDANSESDLSHYAIYRSDVEADVSDYEMVTTTTATSYTDAGLPSEVERWYFVTAIDDADNESLPSNIVSATTDDTQAPGAPGGLTPQKWTGRITIVVEGE